MTPNLPDIPEHFETERLLIRMPQPGDGQAVHEAVLESLSHLRAWPASFPWAFQEPSQDQSEAYCRIGHSAFLARTDMPMLIFLKGDKRLVGATGLHRFDWQVPKCELGYWGRSSYLKRGLVTEAVKAVVQFAFAYLGMRRVECRTDADNMPSRLVAERAGFAQEGIMRDERKDPDGTLRHTCVYALARRTLTDSSSTPPSF
jgi:RimJ/RimL family protein N-acetyltransferase